MAKDFVLLDFKDLQDNDYIYRKGDPYPREGHEVSEERKQELRSDQNKRKEPVIGTKESEPVEVADFPKHTGGGYYELSNGDKVKGKDEAAKAEEALKESGDSDDGNDQE